MLVLGWGLDGSRDVDWIAGALGHDEGLDCVRAPHANSRQVLNEIRNWLDHNSNAQTLCLSAHGIQNGLVPDRHSRDILGYGELGETLAINHPKEASALTLFLGACNSDEAAHLWQSLKIAPVLLLVAFAGRPHSQFVQEVLTTFIQQGNMLLPGRRRIDQLITYFDEDFEDLVDQFPGVSFHYRLDQLINVGELPQSGKGSLHERLESVRKLGDSSLLYEAAEAASRLAIIDDQPRKPDAEKPRTKLRVRTIGPRSRQR